MDGFHRRIGQRLEELTSEGLYRNRRVIQPLPDGHCMVDGRRLLNFGGNDYLGLAHQIGRIEQDDERPFGATASSAVIGRTPQMAQLETDLARFEGAEAALVFPTGYAANLGVLQTLIESRDAVLCDRDNHASIIDACRHSAGQFLVYRRDRLAGLEQTLQRRRSDFEQMFLVTDGVFSMDGVVADLAALCDLAERYDACVIVDEAHGTGVLGEHGRGAAEFTETEDRVLLRVGTMSKAMGGLGGFVVGNRNTIDWLRNRARPQFFSTALPPGVCMAMQKSLQLIQSMPERRQRVLSLATEARQLAAELSLTTIDGGVAPIVPAIVGEPEVTVRLSTRLETMGVLAPAIRPPTVASGTARLRLSLSAEHTSEQVRQTLISIRDLLASGELKP